MIELLDKLIQGLSKRETAIIFFCGGSFIATMMTLGVKWFIRLIWRAIQVKILGMKDEEVEP